MAKKGPRSEELWRQIRAEWEKGASKRSLADKYGVTVNAIYNHQKKDGWVQDSDPIGDLAAEPSAEPVIAAEQVPDAAAAKIAELEAKLAAAEEKVAEYRPVVDVRIPDTPEGWLEFLGEAKVTEVVEAALASENVTRFRKGLPPLDIHDNPALKEAKIRELLDSRQKAVTAHYSPQHAVRTVKVAKPDGTLIQIVVENQVNNEAGQAGTAIWKAREKGYKLVSPYLCQAYNCWREAAVDASGKLTYSGYCSPEHLATDPYVGKKPVAGVTTSRGGSVA